MGLGLDTTGQWGIVVPPAPGIFILGVMLGSGFYIFYLDNFRYSYSHIAHNQEI